MKKGAIIISIFFLALGFIAVPAKSQAAWGVGLNVNFNNGFNGGYSPYGYAPYGYNYGSPYNGTWGNNPYTYGSGYGYNNYGNNGLRVGVSFGFGNGGYNTFGGYPCMPTNGWGC